MHLGILCYDGALSDPVPFEKHLMRAAKSGADFDKPKDVPRTPD